MFDTVNTRCMSTHRMTIKAMEILCAQPGMLCLFIENNHTAVYIAIRHEIQCKDPQNCTPEELASSFLQHLREELGR